MTHHLDFLLDTKESSSFGNYAAHDFWPEPSDFHALSEIAKRLESIGLHPLWADLTAEDVRPLGWVVRVVVPEMVPLSPTHATRWLGCRRLNDALGVAKPSISDFNPIPHPFA